MKEIMAESKSETENRPSAITVEMVLKSIEETEGWYKQLKTVIDQGKPVSEFISGAISVLNQMEAAAKNPRFPKTKEEAERIKALWIKTAPGDYFHAEKDDRWKDKPWAKWMDRKRDNYAFQIGRQITEVLSGQKLDNNWPKAKEIIKSYGPLIIYNGRSDESHAFSEAVKIPWLRIPDGLMYPAEKTYVLQPTLGFDPNANMFDTIRTFKLPMGMKMQQGEEIGVIVHAPQAVRFLYALGMYNVIPSGVNIRMFPMPTPPGGFPDYPLQELRGMVNYRFIADPPKLAEKAFPHKVYL